MALYRYFAKDRTWHLTLGGIIQDKYLRTEVKQKRFAIS